MDEKIKARDATEFELLQDILKSDDPWSSLSLSIDSDGNFIIADFFSDAFGKGETLKGSLIDFMKNYWSSLREIPGSYGFHSGLIDWREQQRRVRNEL